MVEAVARQQRALQYMPKPAPPYTSAGSVGAASETARVPAAPPVQAPASACTAMLSAVALLLPPFSESRAARRRLDCGLGRSRSVLAALGAPPQHPGLNSGRTHPPAGLQRRPRRGQARRRRPEALGPNLPDRRADKRSRANAVQQHTPARLRTQVWPRSSRATWSLLDVWRRPRWSC